MNLLPHAVCGPMQMHCLYEVVPDFTDHNGITHRMTINWGDQRPAWKRRREFDQQVVRMMLEGMK